MAVEIFKQGLEIFADQWQAPGTITFFSSGDLDDYITISTTSDRPLITGVGNYLVLGKDATTGHSLDADDILIGEDLEVDGVLYADGGIAGALTMSTLTAGRVVIVGTGGLLADDADFTFSGATLTVTNLGATTLAGAIAGGDQAFTGVGDMTFTAGSIIAAGVTNADTLLFKAGGLSGTTFITLTSNATDVCTMNAITMSGTWLASGTVTMPALTLGGTVTIGGQVFDAGAGYVEIDTTGAVGLLMNGGIVTGGATPTARIGNIFQPTVASDGSAAYAIGSYFYSIITGFSGDISWLTHGYIGGTIATQSVAEAIGVISSLYLAEPAITLGGGATATVATTLYIGAAPTEGVTNAALYIAAGDLLLAGAGTCDFRTGTTDGNYIQFLATDDDGAALAQLEVARMFSANDPWFGLGANGAGIKVTAANLVGFFAATPVAQQVHVADPAGGVTVDAEARTAINAINAMCAAFGLTAVS